jgi:hypothetical protein
MNADAGRPTCQRPAEHLMTSLNDAPPTQSYSPPPVPQPDAPPPPTPPTAWRPPQADHGRNGSLVAGVIILLVGLWFFASRTLELDLPDLDWGRLWPVILIGLGVWIVLGAFRQRR